MRDGLVALAWLALASGQALSTPDTDIHPADILSHVQTVGAHEAVVEYYDGPQWKQIIDGIGTGDGQWLEVYAALKRGSDASASEELDEALFDVSLPRVPYKVFAMIERNEGPLGSTDLCVFTFDAQCPPGGIAVYLERLERALQNPSSPWEQSIHDSCQNGIQRTRAAFEGKDELKYCSGDTQPTVPAEAAASQPPG